MDERSTEKDFFSHKIIMPCSELRDFVSHFWFSRMKAGVQKHLSYHSTANISTEIVFAFAANAGKKVPVFSSAQGHTETYCNIKTGGFSDMFGVSIYSHAIPFFFDVSPSGLANQLVDLSEIMDTGIAAITERLACD